MEQVNVVKAFWSETCLGKCTDNKFEYGNLYRKTINCSFCVNNGCYYRGECERRDEQRKNSQ